MHEESSEEKLAQLVNDYFLIPKGAHVENHTELIKVADVTSGKQNKHEHAEFPVYIAKRALKHFVEERSDELLVRNTPDKTLKTIMFAIQELPQILSDFDRYEYDHHPEKHGYTKHYKEGPSIRVICENKNEILEIKSIHFQRKKDK